MASTRTRIVVVDDHKLMLVGIKHALANVDDIDVVGEAHSGAEVLPLVAHTRPDVVLLDIRLPRMDGLTCLDRLRARYPDVKVVMMTVSAAGADIDEALRRGASGYILKSINPLDLPSAIRQVVEGNVFSVVGRRDQPPASSAGLSEREAEILKHVAVGLSNKAIARELWVTEQTVKFHLTNVYRKLGVGNRTQAARYAHEHGLVQDAAAGSREGV